MSLLIALSLALAGGGTGWRHDGTSVVPGVTPPAQWRSEAAAFKAAVPGWGNATPVALGDQVCALAEPTTVFCVDARTGALRWKATNDYLDTVPAASRAAEASRLARADALDAEMREAQRQVGELRRELRRGADVAAQMAEASRRLDELKRAFDELQTFLTPPVLDIIGYTSATPWTDGKDLYVLVGHGVVSKFTASGQRVWSTWLGPPPRPMQGYEYGSVASPRIVGGKLIVAHGHLRALDPATGRELWKEPQRWDHYGTPAVMTVGGVDLLFTPDGRAVRASDGVTVAQGLASIWYSAPAVHGDVVAWVGGFGDETRPDNARAVAYRIAVKGAGVEATKLWDRVMPHPTRIYVGPLFHDGLLYVLTLGRDLVVLDAATGALVWERSLKDRLPGTPYQNLTMAGGLIFAGDERGNFVVFRPGRAWAEEAVSLVPGAVRATPLFVGDRVYVRSLDALWCFSR